MGCMGGLGTSKIGNRDFVKHTEGGQRCGNIDKRSKVFENGAETFENCIEVFKNIPETFKN